MGSAVIFDGTRVKTLKNVINLNGIASVAASSVDPTSIAQSAQIGSLYLYTGGGTGVLYIKQDSGSTTNWNFVVDGSSNQTLTNKTLSTPAFAGGSFVIKTAADPSKTVTITIPNVSSSYTLTLPSNDGDGYSSLRSDGSGNLQWLDGGLATQAVSASFTASFGVHYLTNTSTTGITATLPAGALGRIIRFSDTRESWHVNPLTIIPASGDTIDNLAANESLVCDVRRGWVELSWDGTRWSLSSLSTFNNAGITQAYRAATSPITLSNTDYYVSASGSTTYAITLPSATGIAGRIYVIKSNMNVGILLTVNTTTSQTIDGATSITLSRFSSLQVISNGSNWEIF